MSTYAELSRENPPSKMVVKAVDFCTSKASALDLGAGSLRNSKYLLKEGFAVTAVDKDPFMEEEAAGLNDAKIGTHVCTYGDYDFPESAFDLVVAINSLPFESPAAYPDIFNKMLGSMRSGAVLCMTFFGPSDGWAARPEMTFHSREDIETLCSGLGIISLDEIEEDSKTIKGDAKHWHVFQLIARKP
jgi:SAM-dependent methyltransferase